jgi:hypothetical protein
MDKLSLLGKQTSYFDSSLTWTSTENVSLETEPLNQIQNVVLALTDG